MTDTPKPQPVWRCTNGNITREEGGDIVLIARIDLETKEVSFETAALEKKYRLSVIKKLKKWEFAATIIAPKVPETEPETPETDDEHEASEEEGITEPLAAVETTTSAATDKHSLTVEQRKAIQRLRKEQGFPDETESPAPPEPEFTDFGDKDPKFVEWMLRYHPEEFAVKYGILEIGKVSVNDRVFNPDSKTWRKVKREVEGVLSIRKTHLTLKPVKRASLPKNRRRR